MIYLLLVLCIVVLTCRDLKHAFKISYYEAKLEDAKVKNTVKNMSLWDMIRL
mgnify:CR=1 FL=1